MNDFVLLLFHSLFIYSINLFIHIYAHSFISIFLSFLLPYSPSVISSFFRFTSQNEFLKFKRYGDIRERKNVLKKCVGNSVQFFCVKLINSAHFVVSR
jgi:hypothetical protein